MPCSFENSCCQQAIARGLNLARHAPQCTTKRTPARPRMEGSSEQLGVHEDAPPSSAEAMRLPPTTAWSDTCASMGRIGIGPMRVQPKLTSPTMLNIDADDALRVRAQVERDLHQRGVLCDSSLPCNVSVYSTSAAGVHLKICLPDTPAVRGSRTCEAYGELWQQVGGRLVDEALDEATVVDDRSTSAGSVAQSAGCTVIDVSQLVIWWRGLQRRSPFVDGADDDVRKLIRAKPISASAPMGRQNRQINRQQATPVMMSAAERRAADVAHYEAAFWNWRSSRAVSGSLPLQGGRTRRPQRFGRCAVVGSGHDL